MSKTRGCAVTAASAMVGALLVTGCTADDPAETDSQPSATQDDGHSITLTTLPQDVNVTLAGGEPVEHSGTATYEVDESDITADGGVKVALQRDGFNPDIATYEVDEDHTVAMHPNTDAAWEVLCDDIGDDQQLLAEHDPEGKCDSL
ncbi:hypothetical protein GCM10027060_26600 [Nesterenkonia halophila]